jgi:hypothetical protein
VEEADMRDFPRFALRAIQSQPVQSGLGAAMTVSGVSYQDWIVWLTNEPPSWATNHGFQLAIIAAGVLVLAYVFWHQTQSEIGNQARSDIGAVDAFKSILSRSRRSFELVRRRQELLNIPVPYEPYLTDAGIVEGRLRRRLKEELHDALRQGHVKSWATPRDGGPEKPIEPHEWGNVEIEFSDDELYAIPYPFGGDRQISAWQRRPNPRGKIHCYLNVRFSSENLYKEFPLKIWPRRIDYVPFVKDRKDVEREQEAV